MANILYARNTGNELTCHDCDKIIEKDELEVDSSINSSSNQWYHVKCFFENRNFDGFQKDSVIFRPPIVQPSQERVSLEDIDCNSDNHLDIRPEDLTKLRELLSLANEHKTPFFIPQVARTAQIKCPKLYCIPSRSSGEEEFALHFQNHDYHPECLSRTGRVNVDAKEIQGYYSLTANGKEMLKELFKKNDNNFNRPRADAKALHKEQCSDPFCLKFQATRNNNIEGLRILFQAKAYHPKCFAAMRKINIASDEIHNYENMNEKNKTILNELFKKYDDFDVPSIIKFASRLYCSSLNCPYATNPSKFPWPYTISSDEPSIFHRGEFFHTRCFFSNTDVAPLNAHDFYGYENLVGKEKEEFDRLFINNRKNKTLTDANTSENVRTSDQPLAKRRRVHFENDETQPVIEESSESSIAIQNHRGRPFNTPASLSVNLNNRKNSVETRISNAMIQTNIAAEQHKNQETASEEMLGDESVSLSTLTLENEQVISTPVDETTIDDISANQTTEQPYETNISPLTQNEPLNTETMSDAQNSYDFEVPNYSFIRSTLEKLQFPINRQALTFWAKVAYDIIPTASTPTSTLPISSADGSFFKCLSCFFTGDESSYDCIKAGIQSYFRTSFKTFGTLDGVDYSKLYVTSKEVKDLYECKKLTNVHFDLICSWLKCRMGIFSAGQGLQKYGNWNEKAHPILLMQKENDWFKPVLRLT